LDLAPAFAEDLWYHLPEAFRDEQYGFVRQTNLHGTSFSLANGMAIPASVVAAMKLVAGWYQVAIYTEMSEAAYSGRGDFLGPDGRFTMVAYEHALLARAHYLESQGRLEDAIERFDTHPPREPDDFLELGLMRFINGESDEASHLLSKATEKRPRWDFPNNVLAQLRAV
jgi:Tfp pilus assembly protein PilF